MPQTFYIGRVARETGLSVHAIRFYEREGLLKAPLRSEGRFRIFSEDEVRDLKLIRRAQELGFSLAEVHELLVLGRTTPQACAHGRGLLTGVLRRVDEKLRDLARLQHELRAALRKCDRHLKRFGPRPEKMCPVLEELERANGNRSARAGNHPPTVRKSRRRPRAHPGSGAESRTTEFFGSY